MQLSRKFHGSTVGLVKQSPPLVSYTTGLICHGSMGVSITGHDFEIILLFAYSTFVFYTHLVCVCQYSKDTAMDRHKTPWCPEVTLQLSSPNHTCSSAVFSISLQCYVTLDKGQALAGTPAHAAFKSVLLTSKKGKFKQLPSNGTLHFLIFGFP